MSTSELIFEGIYLIGGPGISHPQDASVYIIDCGEELVMIDSGAGKSSLQLKKNIENAGLDPHRISTLILTHCHVDHIGSALYFRDQFSCRIVAHNDDADAIESGDSILTAASWYNTSLPQTPVDKRLIQEHEILTCSEAEIHCLYTPGHTPGSIVCYLDRLGSRILFGQDIHGPFSREFKSDIVKWRESMDKLLGLQADILCEGHFGIFQPRSKVERYIRSYMDQYACEYS